MRTIAENLLLYASLFTAAIWGARQLMGMLGIYFEATPKFKSQQTTLMLIAWGLIAFILILKSHLTGGEI